MDVRLKLLLAIFIFLVCIGIWVTDTIPPHGRTISSIGECAVRTKIYFNRNDRLPSSLADLPKRNGYANSVEDGFGRELQFEVRPDRIVFASYGKDGTPGGSGKNADAEIHYLTHKPDGSLWISDPNWIIDAERRVQIPSGP